jgi:hypothetical protein
MRAPIPFKPQPTSPLTDLSLLLQKAGLHQPGFYLLGRFSRSCFSAHGIADFTRVAMMHRADRWCTQYLRATWLSHLRVQKPFQGFAQHLPTLSQQNKACAYGLWQVVSWLKPTCNFILRSIGRLFQRLMHPRLTTVRVSS